MYKNKTVGRCRKAQFFIISAILIVIAVYGLEEVLNQDWRMDVAAAQGRDHGRLLDNLERAFISTVAMSENLSIDLAEFEAAVEKLAGRKGFYAAAATNSSDMQNASLFLVLESSDSYLEKEFSADRECLKADPYFTSPPACSDLYPSSRQAACCSKYGRCC